MYTNISRLNISFRTVIFVFQDVERIVKKLEGYRISLGVKTLLDLLDMVKQMDQGARVNKLLTKLESEGFITPAF